MKKYLRNFRIAIVYPARMEEEKVDEVLEDLNKRVNRMLEVRKITAEDVVSITLRHVDQYETYTVWYRSDK